MANEILVGLITATSFPVGLLLYNLAREELESFVDKISKIGTSPVLRVSVTSILLGLVLGTVVDETSALLIFVFGVFAGSLLLPDKDKIKAYRNVALAVVLFLASFFLAFFFIRQGF